MIDLEPVEAYAADELLSVAMNKHTSASPLGFTACIEQIGPIIDREQVDSRGL